jgi:hypothetical protein
LFLFRTTHLSFQFVVRILFISHFTLSLFLSHMLSSSLINILRSKIGTDAMGSKSKKRDIVKKKLSKENIVLKKLAKLMQDVPSLNEHLLLRKNVQ